VKLVDISTPISATMAVFPGDPPVAVRRVRSIEARDPYNLSELSMSTHTGTHVDPPFHFVPTGPTADQLDLETLNGPCHVLDVPDERRTVDADVIESLPEGTERVLLRTGNSALWAASEAFFPDYVALTMGAADALVRRRVRLVGIDALSIERDSTGTFPVHHRLLGANVLILEGLRLAGVPAQACELRCLPLRLLGGDGAPARAVLLTD